MAMTRPQSGMQRYIADSNSALLGLQPEDWLDMAEPVNIPGTSISTRTGVVSCPHA
jgi:4-alpha-glucanotransferase